MVYKPTYRYEWRNTHFSVKPDDAAAEICRIQQKYGAVTHSNLLDESRDENAVMHRCYEWDDAKAAEKFRLQQSKMILSSLVVVYEPAGPSEEKKIEVRAFQNVSEERDGSFLHIDTVLADYDLTDIVMRRAMNELAAFKKKYADLEALSGVFSAIDVVMEANG